MDVVNCLKDQSGKVPIKYTVCTTEKKCLGLQFGIRALPNSLLRPISGQVCAFSQSWRLPISVSAKCRHLLVHPNQDKVQNGCTNYVPSWKWMGGPSAPPALQKWQVNDVEHRLIPLKQGSKDGKQLDCFIPVTNQNTVNSYPVCNNYLKSCPHMPGSSEVIFGCSKNIQSKIKEFPETHQEENQSTSDSSEIDVCALDSSDFSPPPAQNTKSPNVSPSDLSVANVRRTLAYKKNADMKLSNERSDFSFPHSLLAKRIDWSAPSSPPTGDNSVKLGSVNIPNHFHLDETSVTAYQKERERREKANQRERDRVKRINDAFDDLLERIPKLKE